MDNDKQYSFERPTELLQEKGIRPSAQRIAVLTVVANSREHPSADEIYNSLSKTFRTLSRTTVYNSLKILSEAGLLRELEIESGCSRYDLALRRPHSHFVCRRCSRIFDMPMPEAMSEIIARDFLIDTVEITLRGLCPECKSQQHKTKFKQK